MKEDGTLLSDGPRVTRYQIFQASTEEERGRSDRPFPPVLTHREGKTWGRGAGRSGVSLPTRKPRVRAHVHQKTKTTLSAGHGRTKVQKMDLSKSEPRYVTVSVKTSFRTSSFTITRWV